MRDPREVTLPTDGALPPDIGDTDSERRLSVFASQRLQPSDVLDQMPEPNETRRHIQRQCKLTANGPARMAVVVFDVGDPKRDNRPVLRLLHALWKRARGGDEIGWFERNRVAVMLQGAAHSAAHRFAMELSRTLAGAGEPPRFKVIGL